MTKLIFIDTETTGLNPTKFHPYEVAWAGEVGEPKRLVLPHRWRDGDPAALAVGHYLERRIFEEPVATDSQIRDLHTELTGVTLVGSNPGFDAVHLAQLFRRTIQMDGPWHHRMIDVASGAMWVFGWERPKGLADVVKELRARGHEIPKPNHSAVGDVITTRAVYFALRDMRASVVAA